MSVPPFPIIPPVFDMLIYREKYMHEEMMYIFIPRVYIQNMGNGNAFREQINTNTLKNEMEAKEDGRKDTSV